jgi:hypothetical protein
MFIIPCIASQQCYVDNRISEEMETRKKVRTRVQDVLHDIAILLSLFLAPLCHLAAELF